VGINALFERRGGKYILVHVGYWIVTLALIGGVVCQFAMRS
jgi:hydrogenase maturation factor